MWEQHCEFHQVLIFMNFGHTDLRKSVSGAKFDGQADFDVRLAVAPQKPSQNSKKLKFRSKKFAIFLGGRRKMKRRASSETRFGKVWGQTESSLKGKRPFKVSKTNRNSRSVLTKKAPITCHVTMLLLSLATFFCWGPKDNLIQTQMLPLELLLELLLEMLPLLLLYLFTTWL